MHSNVCIYSLSFTPGERHLFVMERIARQTLGLYPMKHKDVQSLLVALSLALNLLLSSGEVAVIIADRESALRSSVVLAASHLRQLLGGGISLLVVVEREELLGPIF